MIIMPTQEQVILTEIGEGTGKGFNINVHLDCGSGDTEFLAAFQTKLLPAVDHFKTGSHFDFLWF